MTSRRRIHASQPFGGAYQGVDAQPRIFTFRVGFDLLSDRLDFGLRGAELAVSRIANEIVKRGKSASRLDIALILLPVTNGGRTLSSSDPAS
jgi:hypothetical protein